MELQFSEPRVLIDLGLTLKQARVYLALVKSGPLKILAISKISKVARQDVYRVILKLQQLGLVERIIKAPLEYRATPMDNGLSLLLERKTEQFEELKAETQTLRATTKLGKPNDANQIENSQLVLIPKGRAIIEKIKTAIENTQLSMNLVLSFKRFSRGIASTFAESIEIAWTKKVKTWFLLERPVETKTSEQLIQFCREKPSCQIRFLRHYPKTIFGIFDEKEIFIIINPKTDLPGSPALWSNNPSLIALAEDYFEILWLTAMENRLQDPAQT